MNPRLNTQMVSKDASVGAIPEIETAGVTVVLCVLLIAACFAAPILLELPQAMDAAASPGPTIREISVSAASETALRDPQPTADRPDALAERELATWRLPESD